MPGIAELLTITIGWDPVIAEVGALQITWHGVFTAVGIALGVYVAAWLGRRQHITEDDAYSIALVGVPMGIVGARAMWVFENQERIDTWWDVLRINEGGITVYGAAIGGVLGACLYGWLRKLPIMRGLDAAVFGLLLGMAIGRIGDLINGEHVAKSSDLPWAVRYTHPDGLSWNLGPTHPATTYEMIGDLLIIGIMALIFIKLWEHRPAVTFFTGVVLYSAMRFGVSYLRLDSDYVIKDWLTFPQIVSMITFAVGVAGLAWSLLRAPQPAPQAPALAAPLTGATSARRA